MAQFNNASIHVSLYAPCVLATIFIRVRNRPLAWLKTYYVCLAMNL